MAFNAKQGLQAVVAQQRRILPNDVIFLKTKNVLIKEEGLMIVNVKLVEIEYILIFHP